VLLRFWPLVRAFQACAVGPHVGGAQVVGSLTSLKSTEDTEDCLQCPQHSIVNGLSHGQGVSMRRNTFVSPPISAKPRSLLIHM